MVGRARRLFDLLVTLNREEDHSWREMGWEERAAFKREFNDRTVHKDEMIQIIEELMGETVEGTVPELREIIREETSMRPGKSPESRFSENELSWIHRKLKHSRYLEVEDLPDFTEITPNGFVIDGEEYELTHVEVRETPDAPYCDSVEMYYFGPRQRLLVMHGFDASATNPQREHSVVLERARYSDPHKRWVKDSYVEEIEPVAPVEIPR